MRAENGRPICTARLKQQPAASLRHIGGRKRPRKLDASGGHLDVPTRQLRLARLRLCVPLAR